MEKRRIFFLHYKNTKTLAACYMPFIRNGGLFIPTSRGLSPGDQVFLLVRLLDEPTRLAVTGTVVWLTPGSGIGIRFDDRESKARGRIENLLPDKRVSGLSLTM